MTLAALAARLRSALRTHVAFDPRLNDCYVFVKGNFSEQEIAEAFVRVAQVQQPTVFPWSRESRASRIEKVLSWMGEGASVEPLLEIGKLTDADFQGKRELSSTDLQGLNPMFGRGASSLGLDPGARLRLSLRLGLALHADGFSSTPYASATFDGKKGAVLQPNSMSFRIDP